MSPPAATPAPTSASAASRLRRGLVALAVAAAVAAGGCAHRAVKPQVGPTETARLAYFEAMEELVAANYVRAIQLFNQVARSPRYVKYAALARLRIGDALLLQQRHEEAIQAYRAFIAQYGSDPNLPYARYRIAEAYFERLPTDWFATPPAWEMDQSMTRQAELELTGFLRSFPASRFAPEARRMLEATQRMLLEHELYAARYYRKRDAWRAVAWRLDHALRTWPDLATTPERVWEMARAYARAGDVADAARGYALYLERFPEGKRQGDARKALASIREQVTPDVAPAPAPPSSE